jgi:predicted nucleic acid-binding protein
MRFWDSSAVLPLCIDEAVSAATRSLLRDDPLIAAWWSTRIECVSALMRLARENRLTAQGLARARTVLRTLADSWTEVQPSEPVRSGAERLLAAHPLAAAVVWCVGATSGAEFVTFDERLRDAALREGFTTFPARL